MNKKLQKLCFLNRQPSLFRHGCVGMEIIPAKDDDDETIGLSPLALEPLNADYDGDTAALYILHDNEALQEVHDKAFLQSYVLYDSSNKMLATIRHETLYAAHLLSVSLIDYTLPDINIDNLQDLEETIELYNNINTPVYFNDQTYSYGICLLNKWCGFNHVVIDFEITKSDASKISKIIYNYFNKNNKKYYDQLSILTNHLLFYISSINESPTINLDQLLTLLTPEEEQLFKKLPENQPYVGYYIHKSLCQRCLDKLDKKTQLYKLYKSGSRFSKTQLERSVISIGYCANAKNQIMARPITSNLIKGLNELNFFMGADGTRKGIADNARSTPDSGSLERSLVMILSCLEIAEEDCCSQNGLEIVVMSEKHAEILSQKWYKDPQKDMEWELLDYDTAKKYINNSIIIRSPMTCQTPNFKLCLKCFGERKFPTKYIGVTAGQVLAERLTQLTMRTFHESGSAELPQKQVFQNLIKNHLIDIQTDADKNVILEFDINTFNEDIENIQGFKQIDGNKIIFTPLNKPVHNNDAITILNKIKDLLRIQKKNINKPNEYYQKMTSLVLEVGAPYSSFIEMLFANMFVVNIDPLEFWRYNQNKSIVVKYGNRSLASKISRLLGLLYQPNMESIEHIDNLDTLDIDSDKLTIYEKMFLDNL
ncbi:MAG: hypothetical protein ACOC2W_00440 [bacterium]